MLTLRMLLDAEQSVADAQRRLSDCLALDMRAGRASASTRTAWLLYTSARFVLAFDYVQAALILERDTRASLRVA